MKTFCDKCGVVVEGEDETDDVGIIDVKVVNVQSTLSKKGVLMKQNLLKQLTFVIFMNSNSKHCSTSGKH